MPRLPKELGDLVRDPRQPALRRHLRRIPVDPITGKAEWGVVRTPDGFIQAVHSLSEARPIKVGNFEADLVPPPKGVKVTGTGSSGSRP